METTHHLDPDRKPIGVAARWQASAPQLLALFRIVASIIFMQSGTMKLFAFPAGVPPDNGTVELLTQVGIGAVMEVVGGALVLLGFFTRPVAFVLAGEMAVAYFQFHQPTAFWPTMNGGVAAIMFCFLFLYLSAAGPGAWSLDALRARTNAASNRRADSIAVSRVLVRHDGRRSSQRAA